MPDASSSELGSSDAVFQTDLDLPSRRGKVRDVYELPASGDGPATIAIVATDRLSAFDVVLPTPIAGKGVLLTTMAAFWLRWIETRELSTTHLVSCDSGAIGDEAFAGGTTRAMLEGRVTIARRCRVIPVECVVRGYLAGGGWSEYQQTGAVCGVRLPSGLFEASKLETPIFTPATKAESGHDENIAFEDAAERVGEALMVELRTRSLAIYEAAAAHALARGIILADTKFEFGIPVDAGGKPTGEGPMLIDEALTPDSSRFWPADMYEPGGPQPSFDKQFVREHLESLVAQGAWDKSPPGPELPEDVVAGTIERYRDAATRLMRDT